jgi:hypothetical protein
MTCGAGAGGTGLWCLEAPPALSVVSVPSGMSHDASSRVATSKALRGWPEVAARRIGCWSCRLFIRNSSAIHPQFIRQLVAFVLFLRAVGSKDSTERRRPGPLGERPEARRPHEPGGGSDRGNTRCADTDGSGAGRGGLGFAPTVLALASKSRCRA